MQYMCGGSILDETHILTASHCLFNEYGQPTDPFYVGVGSRTNPFENNIEVKQVMLIRLFFNHSLECILKLQVLCDKKL